MTNSPRWKNWKMKPLPNSAADEIVSEDELDEPTSDVGSEEDDELEADETASDEEEDGSLDELDEPTSDVGSEKDDELETGFSAAVDWLDDDSLAELAELSESAALNEDSDDV